MILLLLGTTVREANVSYGATNSWRAWEAHKAGMKGSIPSDFSFS